MDDTGQGPLLWIECFCTWNGKWRGVHKPEVSTRYLVKASITELYKHTLSFKILILFWDFFFSGQLIFFFFPMSSNLSTICHSLHSPPGSQHLSQKSTLCLSLPHPPVVTGQSREPILVPLLTLFFISPLLHSLVLCADLASECGDREVPSSLPCSLTHSFIHARNSS